MTVAEIVAIVILALLIGALFFYGFRKSGPWGSFWSFILILLLSMWLFDVWVTPFGPVEWGVPWLDLILIGFLVALLLAAATPASGKTTHREAREKNLISTTESETRTAVVVGTFFWLLLLMFVVLIFIGIFF